MPLIPPKKLNSKIEELSCKFINKHNEISVGNLEKAMHELISWYNKQILEEIRNKITDIFIIADQREDRVELSDIETMLDELQDTLPAN